ncbi:addiction module killer protein [Thiomicrospira aerophila AL3]|uniref:Addiction module killer protein n=2 Tax=Thiomicrospira aerophila TaxID=92245 RepID=W0DXX7_9GAMM|nr:addiction module killer protein [Thiomicrospira aerophila AL3]
MHGTSNTLYEDAMIAASAKVHHLTVVTGNLADFKTLDTDWLNPFDGARLRRLEQGNRGDFKNIEGQLYELRIDVGQGWRVYYKQAHSELVLLMIAGLKPHQSKDIEKVKGWLKHDTINE